MKDERQLLTNRCSRVWYIYLCSLFILFYFSVRLFYLPRLGMLALMLSCLDLMMLRRIIILTYDDDWWWWDIFEFDENFANKSGFVALLKKKKKAKQKLVTGWGSEDFILRELKSIIMIETCMWLFNSRWTNKQCTILA